MKSMWLIQYIEENGGQRVGLLQDDLATVRLVGGCESVYELALEAMSSGASLQALVQDRLAQGQTDYRRLVEEGRLLPPVNHPDPAHCYVTGTGLTHLGSASSRNDMHKKAAATPEESQTDSMRMFLMGLEGGKPAAGQVGAQPEWFYKGNGNSVVAPGAPLLSPEFALDGGEEPEIVVVYIIGADGTPFRIGTAIGNEFSDHETEKGNYLWLAHSKLRPCAFGPALLLGEPPEHIEGTSRIRDANGNVKWEKPFLSGEKNMSHSLDNLEHHHFKYSLFRQPGDLHIHFLGTATLSVADGVKTSPGDIFEIEAAQFGPALVNPLAVDGGEQVRIAQL